MANAWFRMYAEFATDPKVQMLSEAFQRRFLMLLCIKCSNGDVTLQDEEVAFQLRISNEEWAETKRVLLSKGLIKEDSSPAAWDKRQFRSDSSAERVRKHRYAKKQGCNVTSKKSNAPDTDTDTDTEKSKPTKPTATPDGFAEFWQAYPKKRSKGDAEKAWKKLKPSSDLLKTILEAVEVAKRCDDWRKEGGQFIPHPATWLNAKGWEDETASTDGRSAGPTNSLFAGAL